MSEMRKRREENKQLQTELEPLLEKVKGPSVMPCDCHGHVSLVTDLFRCLEIVQKQLSNVLFELNEWRGECENLEWAIELLKRDVAEQKERKKRWKWRALKLGYKGKTDDRTES